MKFLSEIFDFMFAPAGAFDSESSLSAASNGGTFGQVDAAAINPATGVLMINGAGVDVGGSIFGMDVRHHDYGNCGHDSSTFNHDCGSMFDHTSTSFGGGSIFDI